MGNNSQLKVLVYGATGSQASPVIHELQKKGHYPIAVTHAYSKQSLSFPAERLCFCLYDAN